MRPDTRVDDLPIPDSGGRRHSRAEAGQEGGGYRERAQHTSVHGTYRCSTVRVPRQSRLRNACAMTAKTSAAQEPMRRIDLTRALEAPAEGIFAALAEHERYTRFRGISRARLAREGSPDRNGLGAVRSLASGPIWFDEEITAYEPPVRLDYLIRATNLPLEHHGGSIELEPAGDRTTAHWVSDFSSTGFLPGLSGAIIAFALRRGFEGMLDEAARLARGGTAT
jgi:uncharacterized protein YndB with AHSA1/START domain